MLFHRQAINWTGSTSIGGTWIALVVLTCHCVVGQEIQLESIEPQPVMLLGFDFSADGKHFAVGGNYGVWVYETETGALVHRLAKPDFARAIAFAPNKLNQFATGSDDGAIRVWSIGQQNPLHRIEIGRVLFGELAFFPDGKFLVATGTKIGDGAPQNLSASVSVVNIETGAIAKEFQSDNESFCTVAISHDGQLLAIGKPHAKDVSVHDRQVWKERHTFSIQDGYPSSVAFLNENNDIIVAGGKFFGHDARPKRDGRIWLAKKRGDNYESSLLIQEGWESFRCSSINPNGQNVAVGTTETHFFFNFRGQHTQTSRVTVLQMRSIKSGETVWTAYGKLGDPHGVTFSPDGRMVAMCSRDSVFLFAADSGELVQEVVPPR